MKDDREKELAIVKRIRADRNGANAAWAGRILALLEVK